MSNQEEKSPKAFLVINNQYFPLTQSIINIGRRLTNHVVIDDTRVSRAHAQLRNIKGRYFLMDLNSTGGTLVNNKEIDQVMLYSGDVISLAGFHITFVQEDTGILKASEEYTSPLDNLKKQGRSTSSLNPEPTEPANDV